MTNHIKPAILMLLFFTVLTGVAYPLAVTAIAQIVPSIFGDGLRRPRRLPITAAHPAAPIKGLAILH